MLKHGLAVRLVRSVSELTLGVLILVAGCSGGVIGDGSARFGSEDDVTPESAVPSDPAALSCPGAAPDVAARDGWRSSDAESPASDALLFEIKARPTAANLDGLVALGAETIDDFDKAAITVRFAEEGLVDVRDGGVYASEIRYPYNPGVWYSIGISVDIDNKTYGVEIGPCGEPRQRLIEDAAFRENAVVGGELASWAVWSSQTASLEVSTPAWMPSGGCVPTTCASLGHECGQPSDGCGGTLNCGGCANDKICDTGLCAEGLVTTPAPPGCVADTCDSLYRVCGAVSDGCGGTLSCGSCASGERCTSWGSCVAATSAPAAPSAPSAPSCTPDTCDDLYRECGVSNDGCDGLLDCGTCGTGENCASWGSCVAAASEPVAPSEPSGPTCTPSTCQTLGRECGTASDGCGGALNCGGCGSGASCSSGVCIADSVSPLPGAPSDGNYDHVLPLTGSQSGSSVASAINALGAGSILVRPVAGQSATITGGMTIPRSDVTMYGLNLKGVFTFRDGTVMWGVNAEPARFHSGGGDGWRIRDSVWSGGVGSSSAQGCVGNVHAQNFIGDSLNWIIENSTFKNYVPTQSGCAVDHSEALYIQCGAKQGTIRNTTFSNNGNTAHVFFTWWPSQTQTCYPNDICMEGNTFNNRWTAYYDINSRSELPSSLNIYIDPAQGASLAGPSVWKRACP